jgi:hypothetical protein
VDRVPEQRRLPVGGHPPRRRSLPGLGAGPPCRRRGHRRSCPRPPHCERRILPCCQPAHPCPAFWPSRHTRSGGGKGSDYGALGASAETVRLQLGPRWWCTRCRCPAERADASGARRRSADGQGGAVPLHNDHRVTYPARPTVDPGFHTLLQYRDRGAEGGNSSGADVRVKSRRSTTNTALQERRTVRGRG